MELYISNQITVKTKNVKILNELKEHLTKKNPAYYKLKAMGRPTYNEEKDFTMYQESKNCLIIPRGTVKLARIIAKKHNERVTKYTDDRKFGHVIDVYLNFNKTFKGLYEYQSKYVELFNNISHGVCVMPCGSGKTTSALGLIAKRKISTLIIVHTSELFQQWQDEIIGNIQNDIEPKLKGDFKLGVIGGGNKKVLGCITIATVQTLNKMNDNDIKTINNHFGMVILDECFHYDTNVNTINGQMKIGDIVENESHIEVLSYGKSNYTHGYKKIKKYYKIKRKDKLLEVKIKKPNGKMITLKVTENHKFPDINLKDIIIKDCIVGETLLFKDDNYISFWLTRCEILSIKECEDQPEYVYNIEVEDNHTYFADNVLTNNCHHAPATTFTNITKKFKCAHLFGLSATPNRKDKKEFALFAYIGPIEYTIEEKELEKYGKLVPVKIKYIETKSGHNFKRMNEDWATLTREISKDDLRNDLILRTVKLDIDNGRFPMILCHRKAHAEYLANMMTGYGYKVGLLTSSIPKEERSLYKKQALANELDILICMDKIAGEGLDVPPIDSIHLVFLINNESNLKQFTGRGRRKYLNKDHCLVYIYKDFIYYERLRHKFEHALSERIHKNQERWFKKWNFEYI